MPWRPGEVHLIETSEATHALKEFILGAPSSRIVVNFSVEWAAACEVLNEEYERIAAVSTNQNVYFFTVDVDKAQGYAESCGIDALPTILLIDNGAKVKELKGANVKKLREMLL
eukprot:TRINITY_DN9670_c0_g1_i1.p1 TRINITY_DN9670_c0_g1~~TRINITY_DN9670_c0_g1_i1.p1  ORF type:complete len:114 (+),score=26.04 TRINITY_DN9670_c0_g1_i1:57-398(+)